MRFYNCFIFVLMLMYTDYANAKKVSKCKKKIIPKVMHVNVNVCLCYQFNNASSFSKKQQMKVKLGQYSCIKIYNHNRKSLIFFDK